jgi:hypothetical protein
VTFEYEVISDEEFASVPAKPAQQPSEWEPVLDLLEQGKSVRIPFKEEKDRRGRRLALGRRAAGRGFKVEMRATETYMVARRSDQPYVPPEPAPEPRKRGRPAKAEGSTNS